MADKCPQETYDVIDIESYGSHDEGIVKPIDIAYGPYNEFHRKCELSDKSRDAILCFTLLRNPELRS